jgi:hypothetical protein
MPFSSEACKQKEIKTIDTVLGSKLNILNLILGIFANINKISS